jgi:hypothetical protein
VLLDYIADGSEVQIILQASYVSCISQNLVKKKKKISGRIERRRVRLQMEETRFDSWQDRSFHVSVMGS